MGKNTPDTQTTVQNQQVPAYVQQAQQNLLNAGQNLTNPFIQTPPAYRVAGFTPDQTMGFDLSRDMAQNAFSNPQQMPWYGQGGGGGWGGFSMTPSDPNGMSTNGGGDISQSDPGSWGLSGGGYPAPGTMMFGQPAAASPAQYTPNGLGTATWQTTWDQMGPAAQGNAAQMGQAAQGNAAQANGSQLTAADIEGFMNPYTKDVVDTTTHQLEQGNDRALNAIRARSAGAASFGGSRGALQESEQNRNFGDTLAATTAGLNKGGWDSAAQLGMGNAQMRQQTDLTNAGWRQAMEEANTGRRQQTGVLDTQLRQAMEEANTGRRQQTDMFNTNLRNATDEANVGRMNQAEMFNTTARNQGGQFNAGLQQQTGEANAGRRQQASLYNTGQYNSLADNAANRLLSGAGVENTIRNSNQSRQLMALQALLSGGGMQQQLAQSQLDMPYNMLDRLRQITPGNYGGTTATTQPVNQPSFAQQALPYATLAAALFSDRDAKTDIEKLGKDPQSGVDLYAYRYKNDPKTYPKIIGPMAQDVEKAMPGSTTKVGGKRIIKGGALPALLSSGA
jgi:hypothetical protein